VQRWAGTGDLLGAALRQVRRVGLYLPGAEREATARKITIQANAEAAAAAVAAAAAAAAGGAAGAGFSRGKAGNKPLPPAVERIRRKLLAQSYTAHGADLQALFHRLDADGNGVLSRAELKAALRRAGVGSGALNPSELASLGQHMDTNGDGSIDVREFSAFLNRGSGSALDDLALPSSSSSSSSPLPPDIYQLLRRYLPSYSTTAPALNGSAHVPTHPLVLRLLLLLHSMSDPVLAAACAARAPRWRA
jgi:hypothetical protein